MAGLKRCPARESGGVQCELKEGHEGEHWISDRTIQRNLRRSR